MEICFYIDLDQTRGGGRLQSDFGSISVVRFPDELLALQQAIDFRVHVEIIHIFRVLVFT